MLKKITGWGFVLIALLGLGAANAAPDVTIKELWVSLPTQQVSLVYQADLGFPLGERGAQSVLDCKTGQVTTRGYDLGARTNRPDQAPEDREGASGLLALKVVNTGRGVLNITRSGRAIRFTCQGGKVVMDLSGYATFSRGQALDRDAVANVGIQTTGGMFPTALNIPGFQAIRGDDTMGTVSLQLQFNGPSIGTPDHLVGVGTSRVWSEYPREGLFLLETDGKTLRPLVYGGREVGLKKAVPIKTGKGGTTLTFFYAPDYTKSDNWQKTTFNFGNFQANTTSLTKPSALVFGK